MAIDIRKKLGVMTEEERFQREHQRLDQAHMERLLQGVSKTLAKVDRTPEDKIAAALNDLDRVREYLRGFITG